MKATTIENFFLDKTAKIKDFFELYPGTQDEKVFDINENEILYVEDADDPQTFMMSMPCWWYVIQIRSMDIKNQCLHIDFTTLNKEEIKEQGFEENKN